MKKYPYLLIVRKVIFCACSDLLGRLRQARPDETDHYKTLQVAPIKGAGPVLVEYSLKKRWPENDKDRHNSTWVAFCSCKMVFPSCFIRRAAGESNSGTPQETSSTGASETTKPKRFDRKSKIALRTRTRTQYCPN